MIFKETGGLSIMPEEQKSRKAESRAARTLTNILVSQVHRSFLLYSSPAPAFPHRVCLHHLASTEA